MIRIQEDVMARSVLIGFADVKKVLESKEFIKYIKDNYDNKHTASVDVAVAVNTFSVSAVARPVVSEVYRAGESKPIGGVLVELNNEIFDINTGKYIDTPKCDLMFLKSEEDIEQNIRLSPSDKFADLLRFVKESATDIVLGEIH